MQHINMLVIGDVHICDHAPGKRNDDYKDRILEKLNECVEIAKTSGVTHVLFLGDIFHLKAANRVSHRLVQEMCDVLLSFEVPVIILVGNHDITDGSLDSIIRQPIGMFRFLDNVRLLYNQPIEIDDDILIHPLAGVSDVTLDSFKVDRINKRDIFAVHQSIVPDASLEPEMIQHIVFDAAQVAEVASTDIVLYGHQHRHDGIYTVTRKDGTTATFSNLGAICRLTVGDSDVDRTPQVLRLSIEADEERTFSMEKIALKCVQPAHEAYRLEEHLEGKEHSRDIEETIKKLKATEVSAFSIESVIKDVEVRADIDKRVKNTALALLEEVK